MSKLINHIKKYRNLKEWTQEELANKVMVRRETIMRIEGGKYNPSLLLAMDIAQALEVPLEELFEKKEKSR